MIPPRSGFFKLGSRIQKGGTLLGDMRQLFCRWPKKGAGVAPHRFVRDLLPKATQARASDTCVRAFLPRMIEGSPKDAWKLCAALEDCQPSMEVVVPFYCWITEARRSNRSFAIAHGLGHLCQAALPKAAKKRGKKAQIDDLQQKVP